MKLNLQELKARVQEVKQMKATAEHLMTFSGDELVVRAAVQAKAEHDAELKKLSQALLKAFDLLD